MALWMVLYLEGLSLFAVYMCPNVALNMNTFSVIVDLEATCCDQNSFARDEMEIIEVGAVRVSRVTGEVESEFEAFVKPVRNPNLTDFCTKLTTISQQDVDEAELFPVVNERFKLWLEEEPDYDFCSWGGYDKNQFKRDCDYHKVSYPFTGSHRNLKEEFSASLRTKKRFGLGSAIRNLGFQFEGTSHRGIDDARNIARVYKNLLNL